MLEVEAAHKPHPRLSRRPGIKAALLFQAVVSTRKVNVSLLMGWLAIR